MGSFKTSSAKYEDDPSNHRKKKKRKSYHRTTQNESLDETSITILNDIISRSHHRSKLGDKYILGRELGRGQFGVTCLCMDRETKELLACKSISKKRLRTTADREAMRREVEIMSRLPEHENVVKLKETYEDSKSVHLVMELCEGGELCDRIDARGPYSEREAATLARTVVEVVRMLHAHGVMHRDLKPENFLFVNKKENSALKAIDFGLSVFFKPGERFTKPVGSPYYVAPEVLKGDYGPEADVWSAGVILYILLCGDPPFWAETELCLMMYILRGEINFNREPWPQISDSAKSLVRQMLEPDPKKRLTAQQVLEHPWLRNAKEDSNVPLGDIVRTTLKQFPMMNRLKKKALWVIAEYLSIEDVEIMKDIFTSMDTDGDGKVTYEELIDGLEELGAELVEPEIKMIMEVADVDGNGVIDYGEFVVVVISLQRRENAQHLLKAFMYFDKDESGYIELGELLEGLADASGEIESGAVIDIMREVDTDKDRRISYEEFVIMMKTGTDWRKAARQNSREIFKIPSLNLVKESSLQPHDGVRSESAVF